VHFDVNAAPSPRVTRNPFNCPFGALEGRALTPLPYKHYYAVSIVLSFYQIDSSTFSAATRGKDIRPVLKDQASGHWYGASHQPLNH